MLLTGCLYNLTKLRGGTKCLLVFLVPSPAMHDGPCLVGFPSKRLWEKGSNGFTFEKLFKRLFQGKASLQDCYLSSWTLDRCLIP